MELYKINQQYSEIINELFENGGEITPEIEELMASNADEFDEKGENYMKAIRNLEADSLKFKEEAAFFTEKQKRAEKTVDTLKRMMVESMKIRNIDKKQFGDFKASLRTSESVQVDETFFFDGNKQFIREKITQEADKKAIKEAIKNGYNIIGAKIETKQSLQIK